MKKTIITAVKKAYSDISLMHPIVNVMPNGVSASFSADGLSAVGARPLMAMAYEEVEEIARHADSFVLNLGQPTSDKLLAACIALHGAMSGNTPILIDPVGMGASHFRVNEFEKLLSLPWTGIIKGNASELYALSHEEVTYDGVDSNHVVDVDIDSMEGKLLVCTGAIDKLISSELGNYNIVLSHSAKRIHTVVGTGCLLGSMIGAFLGVIDTQEKYNLEYAAIGGLGLLALCEAVAGSDITLGYGSYKERILNLLSSITPNQLEDYLEANLQVDKIDSNSRNIGE